MQNNTINKIINIGKADNHSDFNIFDIKFQDTSNLAAESLKHLLQGTIMCEIAQQGSFGYGSATPTPYIYEDLIKLDYEKAIKVTDWAKKIGFRNPYFPYGTRANNQTHFYRDVLAYSKDEKERDEAILYLNEHDKKQLKTEQRVEVEQQDAKKKREYQDELKENDKIDTQNGIKKNLYKKLEALSSFEKLEIMASDTKHSPKFYPSNMVHQISEDDIKKLDDEKKKNLKKMFSVRIKGPSPWATFKKRHKEIIG